MERLTTVVWNLWQQNTQTIESLEAFKDYFKEDPNNPQTIQSGFAICYAIDDPSIEAIIKPLKVSARCIPQDQGTDDQTTEGTCIFTGQPTKQKVIFARAY